MQIQMIPIGGGDFGDPIKMFAALHNAVRDESAEGERFMATYPAKPSSQRYIRTGTLRRSWSSNVRSGGNRIEGEIGSNSNIAPYNEKVQGSNQDPIFERHGWQTVDDLQKRVEKSFPQRAQEAINKSF